MDIKKYKPNEDASLKTKLELERLKHYQGELKAVLGSYSYDMTPEAKIKHYLKVKKLKQTIRELQIKIKGDFKLWN